MSITVDTYKIEDSAEPWTIVRKVDGYRRALKAARSLARRTGRMHYVMPMDPAKAGRVTEVRADD